jgi:AraC-like DNA-binding protein
MAMCCSDGAEVSRVRLLEGGMALVESLDVDGPRGGHRRTDDYSPEFQICLPYRGAFVWHVGRDDVVADPNRVLFVTGDEAFRISRPVDTGYGELIVTAPPALFAHLLGTSERRLADHVLFRRRSRPASAALQRLGVEFLNHHAGSELAAEEALVTFLRASLEPFTAAAPVSPSTLRLVGRAKAYLAQNLSRQVRLEQVARAAGTTPAYLTTMFRRLEGRPLHNYLVQLRLAHALVELPHTSDITALACDLGFANHSHFTAAFRRTFGCTPSAFRESMRRDREREIALTRMPATTTGARARPIS